MARTGVLPQKDMGSEVGVTPRKDMGPEAGVPPRKGMGSEVGKGAGIRDWGPPRCGRQTK